jgi:hypothetical protein
MHTEIYVGIKHFVNFLTNPQVGRSILKPKDVMIYRWMSGRHACMGLTQVSLLERLRADVFIVRQATLKVVSSV